MKRGCHHVDVSREPQEEAFDPCLKSLLNLLPWFSVFLPDGVLCPTEFFCPTWQSPIGWHSIKVLSYRSCDRTRSSSFQQRVMNFLSVSLLFWCFFVAQVKMCKENEIRQPANGSVSCMPPPYQQGLECLVTCRPGFHFPGGEEYKYFFCSPSNPWNPQVPDCISEDVEDCTTMEKPCGDHAVCENLNPGFNCFCPVGYEGKPDPYVACEQVDVGTLCRTNMDCVENAACVEGHCSCMKGFTAEGTTCRDLKDPNWKIVVLILIALLTLIVVLLVMCWISMICSRATRKQPTDEPAVIELANVEREFEEIWITDHARHVRAGVALTFEEELREALRVRATQCERDRARQESAPSSN